MGIQKLKNYIQNTNLISSIIVSLLIVVFEVIYGTDTFREIAGNYRSFFGIIGLVLMPVSPIIYGLITKDKVGAIVVGIVPISCMLFKFISESSPHFLWNNILGVTAYVVVYAILGGTAGYLASKRKAVHLLVAICLSIAWILVYLSDLD